MVSGRSQVRLSLSRLRIVIGAMIFGVVSFAAVVLFVGRMMTHDPSLGWIFCGVLGVLGVTELTVYPLVRAAFVKAAKSRYEQSGGGEAATEQVVQSLASLLSVRAAMAEGFGLTGLVFVLVTGVTLLWLAPIISLVFLITSMPTEEKVSSFVMDVTGANPYSG